MSLIVFYLLFHSSASLFVVQSVVHSFVCPSIHPSIHLFICSVLFCRNRKRSEVDPIALRDLRLRLGSDVAGPNGVGCEDDDDESRLIEEEEDSVDVQTRTGNLFISNRNASATIGQDTSVVVESTGSQEVGRGGSNQVGEEEGEEEEQAEGEIVQEMHLIPTEKSRWSRYFSGFLAALKNAYLDLKLFFWYCH